MNSTLSLIGRETEDAALRVLLDRAREGTCGSVLIAGEAGVGKSLLTRVALAKTHFTTVFARSAEDATPPYGPVATGLRACLRAAPVSEPKSETLSAHLAVLLPERGNPPESVNQQALIESVSVTFAAAAAVRPLAIVLDDLQWADNATLELIPALVERLAGEPFVIVCTYRNDEVPYGHPLRRMRNELRRAKTLHEITLGPLEREAADRLTFRALGGTVSPTLAETLYERTQGVPLFIEELARTLRSGTALTMGPDGLTLAVDQEIPLPESVRDAVLLRMDGLTDEARSKLEVAAVIGNEFSWNLLVGLTGSETGIDDLLKSGFWVETSPDTGSFRHALSREAVLGAVLWSRRRTLHREIAESLEGTGAPPEVVAEHWIEGNEIAKGRRALVQSAENSFHIHAYRDATRAADRALELWPEGEDESDRIDLLERLAHCAHISGQLGDAVRSLREVVGSAVVTGDPRRLAETHRNLATVYGLQGAWEHAMASREAAATAFEAAALPGEAGAELLAKAGHLTATMHHDQALDTVRRAVRLAEAGNRPDVRARAMGLEGVSLAIAGRYEEGKATVQAGLSLALEHNLTEAASEVYRRLASAMEYAGDYTEARETYFTAYDYCQAQGEGFWAQVCLGCLSFTLFMTGDWKRDLEICRNVLNSDDAPDGTRAAAACVTSLIHTLRGQLTRAQRPLRMAATLARRTENLPLMMFASWTRALILEQGGRDDEAAHRYREVVAIWKKTQDIHDVIPILCWGTFFFSERGLAADVSQCSDVLSEVAGASGTHEALAALAFALGETAVLNDDPENAVVQYAQAINHMDRLDVPVERVLIEFRYGAALARAKKPKEAVDQLTAAYRTARRLGARPLAARIAGALDDLDANPEPRRAAGTAHAEDAGLTRRQVEVVRLLAAGLTNKEIADKLFLSPRTVDMHVSNILTALDCRTRTEAVSRAGELGLVE